MNVDGDDCDDGDEDESKKSTESTLCAQFLFNLLIYLILTTTPCEKVYYS